MTEEPNSTAQLSAADIDILEASFRCVTDASAFDDMVAAWDRRLSSAGAGHTSEASDAALSKRLSVINDLMARFEIEPSAEDRIQRMVSEVDTAAFVMSASGGVVAANLLAEEWFGVLRGSQFSSEAFDHAAWAELDAVRRSCKATGNRQHAILRIATPTEEPALAEAFVLDLPNQDEGVLVVRVLELPWNNAVSRQLAEAFGLTSAEIEISRLLMSHCDTARVAEVRRASVLTVRTQLRSIFAKTGTATQVDLVRLLALLCARSHQSQHAAPAHWQDPLRREQSFFDPDGRRIAFSWMGAENGVPAILVHAAAVGYILPPVAQDILAERGIQLYTISRPGFGNSDPARSLGPVEAGSRAVGALQSQLGIGKCLGVGFSSAIIPLVRYASRATDRMPRLMGVGGCMPLDEIDNQPVFQRTFFKLARHAPWAASLCARAAHHVIRFRGAEWYLRQVYAESPVDLAILNRTDMLPLLRSTADMQFAQGIEAAEDELKLLLASWHEELRDDVPQITMLHGKDDRFYIADQLQNFAARYANVETELVENAADLIAFQHPELVAHRIADLAILTAT